MGSLINDLNGVLVKERGIVEAAAELISELDPTDPDIARSARDIVETAEWVCQGLYHRISQLGGTSTLDTSDLAQRVSDADEIPRKIRLICAQDSDAVRMIKNILHREDVDEATSGFLDDVINARRASVLWCESTLAQWKPDK